MAKKKVTKSQIIEGLKAMADVLTLSVQAQSELDFTLDTYNENPRHVTMDDLREVKNTFEEETGRQLIEFIPEGDATVEPKSEGKKIPEKKKESKVVENNAKETPVEPKKPVVVPKTKKEETPVVVEEKKPEGKKTTSKVQKPHNDYLASFPETLVSQSLKGTLKIRKDLVTIQDVADAWAKNEDIVVATYWTKKLLKQYAQGYDPLGINPNSPKSFEHDLDLIEVTFANALVVTGCSLYSYVPQILVPRDFEQDEDGMRYANGCEFQVYEVISEE